ncbi:hypothetical protein P4P50_004656 [Salmonella enterica]|nr:hypothetical protein [Salmonella enterica]EJC0484777.1 hypothetical protein [Salmonella enterica]EJC0817465.1 hypothetical protein [Salmonella enterica]EJX4580913.1 hypothetical protein [Salmonella enterica]EKQ0477148.1 hypothetical protein [Salmonella enterica]
MARLVKNIDTRQYGPLKAGRLLDGVLPPEKIAELIASGHAVPTEDDESCVSVVKNAENASGEGISLFDAVFSTGYAYAINDAVDSGLISTEEAATCGLMVPFEDNEVISNCSPVGEAGGDTSGETAAVAEKPDVKSTDKSTKGSTKK